VSPLPGDSYLGKPSSATTTPVIPWRFIRSIAASPHIETSRGPYPASATDQQPVVISRVQLSSAEQFCQLVRAAEPVILEQLDIGSCTLKWTSEYLKEKVGSEREVDIPKSICKCPNANFAGDCPRSHNHAHELQSEEFRVHFQEIWGFLGSD
jgi:hypothetical protein